MKIFSLLLLWFCLASTISSWGGEDPTTLFKNANTAYEQGKFEDAVAQYLSLIQGGWESPALYFNLGNAYFRSQQLGRAIAAYETAHRLAPRDADIRFNLRFAKSFVKETPLPNEPLLNLLTYFYEVLPLDRLAMMCALIWYPFLIMLLAIITKRWKGSNTPLLACGFLLLFTTSWLAARTSTEALTKKGIVVQQNSEGRSGPGLSYTAAFTVPEGKQVLLLQEQEGWCEVVTSGERLKGWLPQESVQLIATP